MPDYRVLQKERVGRLEQGGTAGPGKVSVVPMQSSYLGQPERTLTTVLFVPPDIGQRIQETLVRPLFQVEPEHHYYPTDALHLTIKNVRSLAYPLTFSAHTIATADRVLADRVPRHAAFDFSLEELVAFRTSVALIGYTERGLQRIIQDLDAGLRQVGLPDDKRYVSDTVFFGNITLCRFVRPPSPVFLERVASLRHAFTGVLNARRLHLITADAVCSPQTRRILGSYDLSPGR